MSDTSAIWLVANEASGSNSDAALEALEDCCGRTGWRVAHRTYFPQDDLPTPKVLDAAGVETVAIFAGDGTINASLEHLSGWGGNVLILPGGTMNLLYHRLHGQRDMEDVLAAVSAGDAERRRPGLIRCDAGAAYAGLMAGPGTSWYDVREAMRDNAVLDIASGTLDALGETLDGPQIACIEPELGRRQGYPLLLCDPHDDGIEVVAFHAETAMEYAQQTFALMKRDFREGPHETLGKVNRLRFASEDGGSYGLLIDGEAAEGSFETEFVLACAEVDLLSTGTDG